MDTIAKVRKTENFGFVHLPCVASVVFHELKDSNQMITIWYINHQ